MYNKLTVTCINPFFFLFCSNSKNSKRCPPFSFFYTQLPYIKWSPKSQCLVTCFMHISYLYLTKIILYSGNKCLTAFCCDSMKQNSLDLISKFVVNMENLLNWHKSKLVQVKAFLHWHMLLSIIIRKTI